MKNIREANMKELKEKAARHKKQWNDKLDILSERVAKLESVHRAAEKDRQSVPLQKSIKEMEQIQLGKEWQKLDTFQFIVNTLIEFDADDREQIIRGVASWYNHELPKI